MIHSTKRWYTTLDGATNMAHESSFSVQESPIHFVRVRGEQSFFPVRRSEPVSVTWHYGGPGGIKRAAGVADVTYTEAGGIVKKVLLLTHREGGQAIRSVIPEDKIVQLILVDHTLGQAR